MTTEEQTPRKRRRRRRRGNRPQAQPTDSSQTASPDISPGNGSANRQGGRKRSRRRRRGRGPSSGRPEMAQSASPIPVEEGAVEGVLHVRASGTGVLVNLANNFAPRNGDPIVPRTLIERHYL